MNLRLTPAQVAMPDAEARHMIKLLQAKLAGKTVEWLSAGGTWEEYLWMVDDPKLKRRTYRIKENKPQQPNKE